MFKPADARSDIYGFGCVFYQLLTGTRPGRDRAPLKSAVLEAIMHRCLADDPAKRFQSAAELKSALQSASANNSRLVKCAVASVVFVVLLIGAAFAWQQRVHAKPKLSDQDRRFRASRATESALKRNEPSHGRVREAVRSGFDVPRKSILESRVSGNRDN